MQEFVKFFSPSIELIVSRSIEEGINPAPPFIAIGRLVCGWATRRNEHKRSSEQKIVFTKFILNPHARPLFSKVLCDGIKELETAEAKCLSALFMEDSNDENISYLFLRFSEQRALETHEDGNFSRKLKEQVDGFLASKERGVYKEIIGFLSKEEID